MIQIQTAPPAEVLLGRPEFSGDIAQAAALVHARRVLVTGAAGSIGWPLTLALTAAEPASLILLDHHEHSLFSLERALGVQFLADIVEHRQHRRLVVPVDDAR